MKIAGTRETLSVRDNSSRQSRLISCYGRPPAFCAACWPKTRMPEVKTFCAKHTLLLCTFADLIKSRLQQDTLIRRIESLPITLPEGRFDLRVYETVGDPLIHLALCTGGLGEIDPATKRA